MASAAGLRGDQRREYDVLQDYELQKAELNGLLSFNISANHTRNARFLLGFGQKLSRRFSKVDRLGLHLCQLYRDRANDNALIADEVELLRSVFGHKIAEVRELLTNLGVPVAEHEWSGSECGGSSLSLCLDQSSNACGRGEYNAERITPDSLHGTGEFTGVSTGNFIPGVPTELSTREFSFHDRHFLGGREQVSIPSFCVKDWQEGSDVGSVHSQVGPAAAGGYNRLHGHRAVGPQVRHEATGMSPTLAKPVEQFGQIPSSLTADPRGGTIGGGFSTPPAEHRQFAPAAGADTELYFGWSYSQTPGVSTIGSPTARPSVTFILPPKSDASGVGSDPSFAVQPPPGLSQEPGGGMGGYRSTRSDRFHHSTGEFYQRPLPSSQGSYPAPPNSHVIPISEGSWLLSSAEESFQHRGPPSASRGVVA